MNPFETKSTEPQRLARIDWRAVASRTDSPFAQPEPPFSPVEPRLDPHEFEVVESRVIRVDVTWGGDVLRVEHVTPGDRLALAAVPEDEHDAAAILQTTKDDATVVLARHATARGLRRGATRVDAIASGACVALDDYEWLEVSGSGLSYRVAYTAAGKPTPRAWVDRENRVPLYLGVSLVCHAAFLGAMAAFVPPMGLLDDEGIDKDRMYLIQQYLEASAERDREIPPSDDGSAASPSDGAPAEAAGAGPAGTIGRPEERDKGRLAVAVDTEAPSRQLARSELIDAARNFGMIGMLATLDMAPSSPFADTPAGNDAENSLGGLFDQGLGDGHGSGGLTLSGVGEGGGFRGHTIGVGYFGTCKQPPCDGTGGWGRGPGRQGQGEHRTKGPRLTMVPGPVSGSLPPTVIQRVVRQNFGRFRQCYEMGLVQNPSLEGRVTARFVIARDGSVATVQSGGADLPNAEVVGCVLRAYRSLSFPAPSDGIVSVTYPITFSPS